MNHRLINDITNYIFMDDTPQKSDIILIPGSSKWQITEKAAELYRAGFAPLILPSGRYSSSLGRFANENVPIGRYKSDFTTDFEYCRHILLANGVHDSAIICEDRATNTMENAMYSAEVVKLLNLKLERAIICCQSFHARRAFISYACYFKGVELLMIPSDTQGITSSNWYKSESTFKKTLREMEKCGEYFVDCYGDIANEV
jgi:uncharacterized SAM-binding protein YcdF (DUF218 family)